MCTNNCIKWYKPCVFLGSDFPSNRLISSRRLNRCKKFVQSIQKSVRWGVGWSRFFFGEKILVQSYANGETEVMEEAAVVAEKKGMRLTLAVLWLLSGPWCTRNRNYLPRWTSYAELTWIRGSVFRDRRCAVPRRRFVDYRRRSSSRLYCWRGAKPSVRNDG